MTDWKAANEHARDDLLEGLAAAGFDVRSAKLVQGFIDFDGRDVPVDVTIPEGFPYVPPAVRPIDGTGGLTWHCDPDGNMCLWAEEQSGDLPWRTADDVIGRAREWLKNAAAGWPNDTPDLDLERYWPRTGGLVVYEDLERLIGRIVRVERDRHDTWQVKAGPPPKRSHQRAAVVLDLAELVSPVRSFEDILDRAGELRSKLERDVPRGRIGLILARYKRSGQPAVLALVVTALNPLTLKAVASADAGDATVHLRAGLDRSTLRTKRVAIVGLGAVGSQVAELLARAGIGTLTLVDRDVVRPGNCIRHLAGRDHVGQAKVEAVRDVIVQRKLMLSSDIKTHESVVNNPARAAEFLGAHDLVVDATANATATRLLLEGSAFLGRPAVSVCLVHEGRVARVDRSPLAQDEHYADIPAEPQPGVILREGGCGDPVSPAPMWAVVAAAARAVAVTVDVLVGRGQYPASIVDVLETDGTSLTNVGTLA